MVDRRPHRRPGQGESACRLRPGDGDRARARLALLAVWLIVNLVKTPELVFQAFLIGITRGAIYALIALGYTLVYGILELINFHHGDVFMLGGMIVITLISEGLRA